VWSVGGGGGFFIDASGKSGNLHGVLAFASTLVRIKKTTNLGLSREGKRDASPEERVVAPHRQEN